MIGGETGFPVNVGLLTAAVAGFTCADAGPVPGCIAAPIPWESCPRAPRGSQNEEHLAATRVAGIIGPVLPGPESDLQPEPAHGEPVVPLHRLDLVLRDRVVGVLQVPFNFPSQSGAEVPQANVEPALGG